LIPTHKWVKFKISKVFSQPTISNEPTELKDSSIPKNLGSRGNCKQKTGKTYRCAFSMGTIA